MTNQLQGEILFDGINKTATPNQWVYSPWVPVQGDKATFGIEILLLSAATVYWNVETRTEEDSTTAAQLFTNDRNPVAVGVDIVTSTDGTWGASAVIKQWVRYRIATNATADATKWVQVRVLPPSWQVNRV
jgi:hypothetical protein